MATEKVVEISIGSSAPKESLARTWGVLQDSRVPADPDAQVFSIVEIHRENLMMPRADKPINVLTVKKVGSELPLAKVEDFIVEQIRAKYKGEPTPGEELAIISFRTHLLIEKTMVLHHSAAELGAAIIQQIMERGPNRPRNDTPASVAA
jgi:hypothetical protein